MSLSLSSDPSRVVALPTMHDLPSDDPLEPGLPDEFHGLQPQLLAETLNLTGYAPSEMFCAFDLNLYYDPEHTGWYKRPDWFLAVGVPRLYGGKSSRSSYVIWDEKVPPVIVVEFLSPGTEAEDLGPFAVKPPTPKPGKPPGKFTVYEQILQVPHYVVFDEATGHLRHFRLVNGRYQLQPMTSGRSPTNAPQSPQLWIPEVGCGLGLWSGAFRGIHQTWLRWCDGRGNWLPTEAEAERAEAEVERAEKEVERAEKEVERAEKEVERAAKEKLARYLRSIGIDPDNLPEV
jgi:Uma2 family endonuclease